MTDLYGCGRHRTDEARELAVMKVEQPPRMQLPYWEGQMHVLLDGDLVSVCHTDPGGQWCPEIFTFSPEDVHATDPLDAWNFNCSVCEMRGGIADNIFVRRFVASDDRPTIDSYPLFRKWLSIVSKILDEKERREKAEN
ncbi:hypothetical protein ACTHQW_13785 [Dietzia maris]